MNMDGLKKITFVCFVYIEKGTLDLVAAEKGSKLEEILNEYYEEHPQLLLRKFEEDTYVKASERN